ncbi:hypothetical protein EDEG_03250 [Edhazardia aedis USNM 41457]|uniref:V-SNARE coiled-coil homology domain-containing protein n=1 Tax=Edhazardia aedis (strain USNM 41457) TaxID=1003232 RepID=J9DLR3_EDHAE|nr:hypothetical protein EDEG_03250 [Edhazardia aedis USNM 41457]|eukprot:EJW02317.1 hypothetical protein EDEG_03250 [Edhazardia aedis USNM 41457]
MILSLLSIDQKRRKITKSHYNLSSFSIFTRFSIKEVINYVSLKISDKLVSGEFQKFTQLFDNNKLYTFFCKVMETTKSKKQEDSMFSKYNFFQNDSCKKNNETGEDENEHAFNNKDLLSDSPQPFLYIVVIEEEYPQHIAYQLLKEMNNPDADFKNLAKEYNDPKKKDILEDIFQELEEAKLVLNKTVATAIKRSETLENLDLQLSDLSRQTNTLFKIAKNQNKCSGCR